MSNMDGNIQFNFNPFSKNPKITNKEVQKQVQNENPQEGQNKGKETQINQSQSLSNTNSNLPVNQGTQSSPATTQSVLNNTNGNAPLNSVNQNVKSATNTQPQITPSQINYEGPRDLPAYAGISNLSLKTWVAGSENKNYTNLELAEEKLAETFDAIQGFQRKNHDGSDDEGSSRGKNNSQKSLMDKLRNLLILSRLFSNFDEPVKNDTELILNITTFKKLGSALKDNDSEQNETLKIAPPLPYEPHQLENVDFSKIFFLRQLLALPAKFPDFLRLFAKENIELNPHELRTFLLQRMKLTQEQTLDAPFEITADIQNFVYLLDESKHSVLLPLLLLYYPLPLPYVRENLDFSVHWKMGKEVPKKELISSCEVYYFSGARGRFLLYFKLYKNNEFTFDVQTSEQNKKIINELERAVAEGMYLLKYPPSLTDLNILLTKEIYKATDINEELSIVSHGPIRLEIVLAVYSSLLILNKFNDEAQVVGLIDISN